MMEAQRESPVVEPEILPPRPNLGRVNWDMQTTLCSPFFWFVVGGLTVGVAVYYLGKRRL